MAAMAAIPTTSTLTPPSSSHGGINGIGDENGEMNDFTWNGLASNSNDENIVHHKKSAAPTTNSNERSNGYFRSPLLSQNGNSNSLSSHPTAARSPKDSEAADSQAGSMLGTGYLSQTRGSGTGNGNKSGQVNDETGSADSLVDVHGSSKSGEKSNVDIGQVESEDDESSKWIHRDKLARIESEELQAAGIILPTQRAKSRPRHGHDRTNGVIKKPSDASEGQGVAPMSRKNSSAAGTGHGAGSGVLGEARTQDIAVPSWDLRTPEEIAEETYWIPNNGPKGTSRIPVAKLSPVPIPADVLERDTLAARRRDSSPGEDGSIKMPKTRGRSSSTSTKLDSAAVIPPATNQTQTQPQPQSKRAATDSSPKKTPSAAGMTRKSSGLASKANGPTGRQKTRGAASKDSTSSGTGTTRPSTRSGERELSSPSTSNKQPEGDPPWMVSAYKPDPRLPPDQQLLPTVARRLQQEKWEREGKFGSVYDKEFRPLTDDGFLSPPEPKDRQTSVKDDQSNEKPEEKTDDWPLKPEPKSPRSPLSVTSLRPQRTGSYSTIPKIQDRPASPRPVSRGNVPPAQPSPLVRIPDVPVEEKKKGCLCCVVM